MTGPGSLCSKDEHFRDEALPHLGAVTNFAISLTHDESDADDLVQDTFLNAYRSWDQYITSKTNPTKARRAYWGSQKGPCARGCFVLAGCFKNS